MLLSFAQVLAAVRSHFGALAGRRRRDAELDAEMRFHLEMAAAKNVTLGMSRDDAERAALVAFGGRERFKEDVRDARGGRWLEATLRDARLAVRGLRRTPGFAVATIASLGIGMGCTVALLTLTDAVLLRPLPYPDSERLVSLGHVAPAFGMTSGGQSEATFVHYRRHSRSFEEIGVYWENDVSLTDGDAAERVRTALATPSVYRALGVRPAIGRLPRDDETAEPQVLVSHELWVRRYGGDASLVGREIEVNRVRRVVVGVMPRGFDFPSTGTQIWYAVGVDTVRPRAAELFMSGIARLRPGVAPGEAQAELTSLVPRLREAAADVTDDMVGTNGLRPTVASLRDVIVQDVRPVLTVLACTSALVLIVAWANAAGLFVVRAERRRREVAVARALGAGSGQLARAFLVEAMLLAVAGGAIGLWLAQLAIGERFGFELGQIPRLHEVRVTGLSLLAGTVLALVSGLLLGLVSVLRAGRVRDVPAALSGAGRRSTATREGQRIQRSLVALQMGLALTLLVAAAMMARSVWRLQRTDPGLDPAGVLAFELNPPFAPYRDYATAAAFHHDLLDRLRGIPGVSAADVVLHAPLAPVSAFMQIPVLAEGEIAGRTQAPVALLNMATPGYFATLGIPLLEGRTFVSGDLDRDAPGIILSRELARVLFRGASAIGRRVSFVGIPGYPPYEVVGVVGGVPGESLAEGPVPTLYLPVLDDLRVTPAAQVPFPFVPREATIVLRAGRSPESVLPEVRRVVTGLDAKIPIADVRTMEHALSDSTARARLTMLLLAIAAGTTMLLGAIGIFGVVSYVVSLRTPEFGIRLALGAQPGDVQRLVLGQGAVVALAGVTLGAAGAVALSRAMRAMLYQVNPLDPVAFVTMPVVLLGIALLASWLPARRAGRIDPASALRAE